VADSYKLQVEGLSETLRLLSRVDKDLRKEASAVLKRHVVSIKTKAQGRIQQTPGVRRSNGYPLSKTAVIHRASAKPAVGINRASKKGRNAAIFPAEFGAYTQFVPYRKGSQRSSAKSFGRHIPQNAMRRRTFPVWRGNQFVSRGSAGPGWIVMPTIRKEVPKIEKDLMRDLRDVFDRAARRAGVPRG
jgi:hypothetical protein